ncbi:MAG: Putative vitamin B12 receptor [uncultured Aureispira sp.]|uniref:Vitamin B12 receptor n=1 Tax=uncultured Aureispira sp. TaxID=1331704 RepID=A0A6S6SVK4_9BACT|nr:MAG: Putative vitamin B12 receptor [uncultured Aureispira sp.]
MKRQTLIYWLFTIALVLMSSVVFGQGTIKGILMDSVENEPMLGAEIRINDKEGNFVTGGASDFVEGAYEISVAAGTYDLFCSYMGYATFKKEITIEKGKTLELNINMFEEANVLNIVTKTASRFETSVGKSSISIDVIQPSLVDNTNATKVDEVVDKVPGVSVVDGQANIRGGSGFSYGAGSRVLLLVDDLPLLSGDAGQPSWRDIPVENISQIEVVKGAASALYGSSALNGIINIRTAYAKNKPFTKVSVFQTSFLTPKRPVTAWWKRDSIEVWDAANNDVDDADTLNPQFLSGRNGYRKPIELGVQFAHRRKIGKYDLTLGGNYFYQDSYRAGAYERKFRVTANNRYRFSTKVNAGINLNFNYGQSASFFLWNNTGTLLFGSGSNDANHIYEPLAGTITESTVMRFNIDPFLTAYDNKDGRHRLQTRYYRVSNENGQNQSNLSHLFYGEYQYQRKFKVESSFFGDFKLVAGAVGTYTFSRSQLFGNADYRVYNAGAYIQGEQGFIKEKNSENTKLNLTFGIRWEVFNIVSPDSVQIDPRNPQLVENPEPNSIDKTGVPRPRFRVGLNYELTPFTFLRASWGEGYRYPTIAERYIATQVGSGASSLAILANPELKPESGWSAEIGIKQGFKIGNWKGFVDLSGFWTEYQDMMEFTFGGGDPTATAINNIFFQSINVDDTRIRGFECSVMGTGNIGSVSFNVLAGYTFIAPEFQNWDTDTVIQTLSSSDYNILKYRNVHNVKFDVEAFFLKDKALSVGFSLNYNSRMENIDKAFEDIIFNVPGNDDQFGIGYYRENFNSGEFTNISARIGYRYAFKNADDKEIAAVKLSLVGKNLLNQEYMIRPALVDAPTNITVRLDVEF